MLDALGLVALAAWIYLLVGRGGYWRARERLPAAGEPPASWPVITAVVPARNEAPVVRRAVESVLAQDYPGRLSVVVVDDESEDSTAARARAAGEGAARGRLLVESTPPRPAGWTGKMWALHSGVRRAEAAFPDTDWWWFTDADVVHDGDQLRRLVSLAEQRRSDLASVMVRLEARSRAERLLLPAFVYFFQLVYPFMYVADARRRTAAAAGGSMLVRRTALAAAGGIEAVRGEVIDDCALARMLKQRGDVWLGLTGGARSIRVHGGLRGVWRMVARFAFAQLRWSWALLGVTMAGLALTMLAPPLLAITLPLHGQTLAAAAGAAAWLLMAWSFAPTLGWYGCPRWWGLALPVAGAVYMAMTADSARRHRSGHGVTWKGRVLAGARSGSSPDERPPSPDRSPPPQSRA